MGREFGLEEAEGVTATTKHQLIAQAEAGNILSLWGKKEGDEFAAHADKSRDSFKILSVS